MASFASRGVFLSYRREDAGPYARSLQLQLSQRISDTLIFMDLDSIEPGVDFAEVIEKAVKSSAVLVVLIGPKWVTLSDEDGARRLDNPDDFVRFEIKTALERGLRVIPVLIDAARPLRQQELPDELHKLARLNAYKLSWDRYQDDADRLLDLIQKVIAAERVRQEGGPTGPGPETYDDASARQEARRQRLDSYSTFLALATEFDSRLDLFTPPIHELAARSVDDQVKEMIKEESERTGDPPPELADRTPLVDSATLPGLKDLLARVTSSASSVQLVGSPAASAATGNLVNAQRRWLLSLERNDPAAAADALAQARPSLAQFKQVLKNEIDINSSPSP